MRSACLLGPGHHVYGAVAAVSEGPAAIAISRGGAPKRYEHTEPNEDAVCFAFGDYGMLAAVADGHYGARGAERAIEWLLDERAPQWTGANAEAASPDAWREAGAAALQAIHQDLHAQATELRLAPAPTTLSIALVRPEEGILLHASVGDSHVFLARPADEHTDKNTEKGTNTAEDVAWATTGSRRCAFAGEQYENPRLDPRQCVVDCAPIGDLRAVLLASDGLSEVRIGVEDPAGAAARAVDRALSREPQLRSLAACRDLTETALEAHRQNKSGDNMCAAVLWLET
jgi:serine/threonine protein phosphatase PrpC